MSGRRPVPTEKKKNTLIYKYRAIENDVMAKSTSVLSPYIIVSEVVDGARLPVIAVAIFGTLRDWWNGLHWRNTSGQSVCILFLCQCLSCDACSIDF